MKRQRIRVRGLSCNDIVDDDNREYSGAKVQRKHVHKSQGDLKYFDGGGAHAVTQAEGLCWFIGICLKSMADSELPPEQQRFTHQERLDLVEAASQRYDMWAKRRWDRTATVSDKKCKGEWRSHTARTNYATYEERQEKTKKEQRERWQLHYKKMHPVNQKVHYRLVCGQPVDIATVICKYGFRGSKWKTIRIGVKRNNMFKNDPHPNKYNDL